MRRTISHSRATTQNGLNGPEGLFLAVINRAMIDTIHSHGRDGHRQVIDALAYFGGPTYRHMITALDREPTDRPAALMRDDTLNHILDIVLGYDYDDQKNRQAEYKAN